MKNKIYIWFVILILLLSNFNFVFGALSVDITKPNMIELKDVTGFPTSTGMFPTYDTNLNKFTFTYNINNFYNKTDIISNYYNKTYINNYHYNKTESDNKYYLKTNLNGYYNSTTLPLPDLSNYLKLNEPNQQSVTGNVAFKDGITLNYSNSYDLSSGLILHYKMNDNAYDYIVEDSSNSNNDGTATSETAYLTSTGLINGALDLSANGGNQYISLTNEIVYGTDATINAWVKDWSVGGALLGSTDVNVDRVLFFYDGDSNWYMGSNTFPEQVTWSSSGLDTSGWHMYTIKKTGTNVEFFFDGVSQGTRYLSTIGDTNYVGFSSYGLYDYAYMNEVIDDLRIYDRTLSDTEMLLLYNSGSGTEDSPTQNFNQDVYINVKSEFTGTGNGFVCTDENGLLYRSIEICPIEITGYLKLNQTTPQTIINSPIFQDGIKDSASTPLLSVEPNNRKLYANDGTTSMLNYDSTEGLYGGTSPNGFLDLTNGILSTYMSTKISSLDWLNRQLYTQDGTKILNWNNPNTILIDNEQGSSLLRVKAGTDSLTNGIIVNSNVGGGSTAVNINSYGINAYASDSDGVQTSEAPLSLQANSYANLLVGTRTDLVYGKLQTYASNGWTFTQSSDYGANYQGIDSSGYFWQHNGIDGDTDKIRMQTSVANNQIDWTQFFIDPDKGFIFNSQGTAGGNVLIGTTTDNGNKLQVNGDTKITGNLNQTNGNATINNIYGEMHNKQDNGFEVVDIVTVDTYVQIKNLTCGENNGFVCSGGNLTAQIQGLYKVDVTMSVSDGASGEHGFKLYLNNTGLNNCYNHKHATTTTEPLSFSCFARINATHNTINVRIDDHANPVNDMTLYGMNVNALRIGN